MEKSFDWIYVHVDGSALDEVIVISLIPLWL